MYGILSFIGFSTSYKRKMVNNIVSIEQFYKGYERFLIFIDVTGPYMLDSVSHLAGHSCASDKLCLK